MESLIDSQHGASTLLAGLVIILCLHLVLKLAQFLYEMARKKNELSERNIESLSNSLKTAIDSIQSTNSRLAAVERDLNEVLKFKLDFRRLFSAVKYIAGDKWPEAKKAMKDYEFE